MAFLKPGKTTHKKATSGALARRRGGGGGVRRELQARAHKHATSGAGRGMAISLHRAPLAGRSFVFGAGGCLPFLHCAGGFAANSPAPPGGGISCLLAPRQFLRLEEKAKPPHDERNARRPTEAGRSMEGAPSREPRCHRSRRGRERHRRHCSSCRPERRPSCSHVCPWRCSLSFVSTPVCCETRKDWRSLAALAAEARSGLRLSEAALCCSLGHRPRCQSHLVPQQ